MRLFQSKILNPSLLKKKLTRERKKNSHLKIVFTNGCFDLLHRGHVTYLEKARSLGDLLVIALNTDASIKKIKGPSRPIQTLSDRLAVLAALESVSYITWFAQKTPLKIIQILKPDLIIKGSDWKKSNIVGAQSVKSWGGRVQTIRIVRGKSTSSLIQKIHHSKSG